MFELFESLAGAGETLQFHATDIPRSWHVTRTTSGIAWDDGDRDADVTVAAPVRDLLLILNRRLPSPAEVDGDRDVWERWRADSRF
ncbi:SCP2 sterol-binding domain-containing protein [Actinoplanes sp. URMC 104]|uniref:SCP2 sterol-binding domain-containing protein n=1 Tax=Actinoplanes sp. URMC 104 TaxID=3423409 RepID=UPI003F1E2E04